MAKVTAVTIIDDIDGTPEAATVNFGLDGVSYEIDLSDENAQKLRDALDTYVAHGRKVGGRRTRGSRARSASSERTAEMRKWARDNGYEVSDRGRLPAAVVSAFEAAN